MIYIHTRKYVHVSSKKIHVDVCLRKCFSADTLYYTVVVQLIVHEKLCYPD